MSKEQMDAVWTAFGQVVQGYRPSQQEIIDEKWRQMAKHSSQKDLLLQKQRNLSARYRAL